MAEIQFGKYIKQLYNIVKRQYNNYVQLMKGTIDVAESNMFIADDVPLLCFLTGVVISPLSPPPLSHSTFNCSHCHIFHCHILLSLSVVIYLDVEKENQGNDWLYLVIADIITRHNCTVKNFYSVIQKEKPLNRFLSEEPSKILPTEVDLNSAIITFTEYDYIK